MWEILPLNFTRNWPNAAIIESQLNPEIKTALLRLISGNLVPFMSQITAITLVCSITQLKYGEKI